MDTVLSVRGLHIQYPDFQLHPTSVELKRGEIVGIVGESGSGKTSFAKGISALLDSDAQVGGNVIYEGVDILSLKEKQRKSMRMRVFSVAFQNAQECLNPSLTLGSQLAEILVKEYAPKEIPKQMTRLMHMVDLEEGDLDRYPRELSGGMVQRFLLASALALSPKVVILDEPTSALDVASRDAFMALIKEINKTYETAFILITHDFKLIEALTTRVYVLYKGHVVEKGLKETLLYQPKHPYTKGLMNASMTMNMVRDIWGIRPEQGGTEENSCAFYNRCTQALPSCKQSLPCLKAHSEAHEVACHRGGIVELMTCENISKGYGRQSVLKHVNFHIYSGEVVAIIGKSGVGKSTLSSILGGFLEADEGAVYYEKALADFKTLHRQPHGIQMVFQDSESALNPFMTVLDAISEPMKLSHHFAFDKAVDALTSVGLRTDDGFLNKKVKKLSGGEKQRLALARALTMSPRLLIADEPTSMLDPSSKANILRLLKQIQYDKGFSMLIVTHDLEGAAKISDRICVLKHEKLEPATYEKITGSTLAAVL